MKIQSCPHQFCRFYTIRVFKVALEKSALVKLITGRNQFPRNGVPGCIPRAILVFARILYQWYLFYVKTLAISEFADVWKRNKKCKAKYGMQNKVKYSYIPDKFITRKFYSLFEFEVVGINLKYLPMPLLMTKQANFRTCRICDREYATGCPSAYMAITF